MTKVIAQLLGTPKISCDGFQITFPFRKVEALFYYLLVKGQATRDELVNLLWAEMDENTAKKNLRNAIYMLKKIFNGDVILSPKRALLILNQNVLWETDLDMFLKGKDEECIKAYKGEFLHGLLVKDADSFEHWMFQSRDYYRDIYTHKLHRIIKGNLKEGNIGMAESCCKLLIQADELDEEAYRILMGIYRVQGQFNKGIEAYLKLTDVLGRELSITPDAKTAETFDSILQEKNNLEEYRKKSDAMDFFYAREKELLLLKKNYHYFMQGQRTVGMAILGEAGIGKSKLADEFIKFVSEQKTPVFIGHCYQAEEKFLLKPWNGIFQNLSLYIEKEKIDIPPMWRSIASCFFPVFDTEIKITDMNPIEKIDMLKYHVAERAIVNILQKVSLKRKVILLIEDIQWSDEMSLSLIRTIIRENKNKSILVMLTCSDVFEEKTERFLAEMSKYSLMNKLELNRLSKSETAVFLKTLLPEHEINKELEESIHKETEGNFFFLVEVMNNIRQNLHWVEINSRMKDVLKNRYLSVSLEGQKILNIASVFFDKVAFQSLYQFSGKNEFELMDILDELQKKRLIREITEDQEISFIFTHQKLREYIYGELSLSRKRILHKRVAEMIEGSLKNRKSDGIHYSKLIYHFIRADNRLGALRYTLKNLEQYLHFCHEVFPVLSSVGLGKSCYLYLKPEDATKQLKDLGLFIQEIKETEENLNAMKEIELAYMHMLGRFHVSHGEYSKGLDVIRDMIERAFEQENWAYALKGYRQMIYYCINTQNTCDMAEYLSRALEIAEASGEKGEMGILLRLKGYLLIMEGRYHEAETALQKAILTFEMMNEDKRYILNIAACYNFLGESKRIQCDFETAIMHYDMAITLCEQNNVLGGLAIFHTNAGHAAFDSGDSGRAKKYMDKALQFYCQLDSLWGRSTAKGYSALMLVKEGKYREALEQLKDAEEDAKKLKSPYEIGLILNIKSEIRAMMNHNKGIQKVFSSYLEEMRTSQ